MRRAGCVLHHWTGTRFNARVDVEVRPWVLVDAAVLEADDPGIDRDVLVTIHVEHPRRVRGHQCRHFAEQLRARRAVGQAARRLVALVELRQVEPGEVRQPRIAAVEQAEKAVALGRRVGVGEPPHLQLARARRLQRIRKLLLDEFDADADGLEAALPQLVQLPLERADGRRNVQHERPAVRQVAPAVLVAVDVAELVEQRPRAGRVVFHVAVERRIVAGHARRHGLRREDRLSLAHHPDLLLGVVGHADRAPQRDLVRGVAADHRVLHVEVGVRDGRQDAAGEPARRRWRSANSLWPWWSSTFQVSSGGMVT